MVVARAARPAALEPDDMTVPLIRTTIAGSLPKPAWLAEPNTLWAPWRLDGDTLAEGKRDAVRLALDDQRRAGIDIVGDGEQTRQHFVTTFIEHLDGVDFVNRRTVRIRNRYDASVPVVASAVARKGPVFVEDARYLRSIATGAVKFTLPGPMTMVDTLYDAHYGSREKLAWEFACILNDEAHALEAAGIDVVQFDEPAFNVYFDEVRDWGVRTLERAAQGLACTTAVHICYGYGIEANVRWKQSLGAEWRQYEQTFPLLAASRIGQVSLECQHSRVPMELIGLLQGQGRARGGDRRRDRRGGNPGGGGGDAAQGARARGAAAPVRLHQLRDGAAVARGGRGQAEVAGRGRGDRAQGDRRRLIQAVAPARATRSVGRSSIVSWKAPATRPIPTAIFQARS